MAAGGLSFWGLRGLPHWSKMAETLGGCSSVSGLPWQLALVVLRRGRCDETEMEALALEMGKEKKEKKMERASDAYDKERENKR